jgi:hypothetical protein
MLDLTVDHVKAVMILQEGSVRGNESGMSNTHPSHSQIRNKLADGILKALASLSVRETKTTTLEWMVYELAHPVVREGVEDRHGEEDAVAVPAQEPKLGTGTT